MNKRQAKKTARKWAGGYSFYKRISRREMRACNRYNGKRGARDVARALKQRGDPAGWCYQGRRLRSYLKRLNVERKSGYAKFKDEILAAIAESLALPWPTGGGAEKENYTGVTICNTGY
jgi:hypothetical protein